ncbi:CinA family protein [uncultured Methylovirgula sp.]|uniref:CinA family protein n=1 Tax=uncultured Methylovirgula sp. TaxID=1285960 RepID=UPI002626BCFE|nr:CinA family protein [uncultured Methylovirgula sp.]
MFSAYLRQRATALLALYRERGLRLVTAESCTGGLLAGLITEIPGSSDVFERGYVTYSNRAKVENLGVATDLIARFGAVSAEVAAAMADGALRHAAARVALSVTGIAGPDGGSAEKPVGLVYFGYGRAGTIATLERRFGDIGRSDVRLASVETALDLLLGVSG